jgi:hypothetical protein
MEELDVILRLDTYHLDKKFTQEEFEIFKEQFRKGKGTISLEIPVCIIRDFCIDKYGIYSNKKTE